MECQSQSEMNEEAFFFFCMLPLIICLFILYNINGVYTYKGCHLYVHYTITYNADLLNIQKCIHFPWCSEAGNDPQNKVSQI